MQLHCLMAVSPWALELLLSHLQMRREKLTLFGCCDGDNASCLLSPSFFSSWCPSKTALASLLCSEGGQVADLAGGMQVGTICPTSGLIRISSVPSSAWGNSKALGYGEIISWKQPGPLSHRMEGHPPNSIGIYVNKKSACIWLSH